MKKFLPLILLLLGLVVVICVFLIVKSKNHKDTNDSGREKALLNLSLSERPFVSLTPTSDGHYLKLKIEKFNFKPASLDYELVYQVPGGVQQGIPGSVNLVGKDVFEAELLLGSESSGKFRYDEGVEEGILTLRFRDKEGKLLVKYETGFHMQTGVKELTSVDGAFSYIIDDSAQEKGYYIVMNTIGIPDESDLRNKNLASGPFGVYSSLGVNVSGKVTFSIDNNYYRLEDKNMINVKDSASDKLGVFVAISD